MHKLLAMLFKTKPKESLANFGNTFVTTYRSKNYTGSNKAQPPVRVPKQIMVHYTCGEIHGRGHVLDWICDPASEVSYHYVVGYDGTIYNIVDDQYLAWHGGSNKTPDYDENKLSIGVALESAYNTDKPSYTAQQIAAVTKLLAYLSHKWGIFFRIPTWGTGYHKGDADWRGFIGIMGHESTNAGKSDPGVNFPWDKVMTDGKRLFDTLVTGK